VKNPTFARMGKAVFSSKQRLAILGGGQLGKMMLVKCRQWDVLTKVLDPSPTAPARLMADEFIIGDLMDYQTVVDFGQQADVVTIEIENVNIEALYTLEKQGKKVYPKPSTLEIIQSKARQKQFYADNQFPTSKHKMFAHKPEWKDIETPCIWKASRFGYDGFGVKKIETQSEWESIPDVPCILEDCVSIAKEIAVIVARNDNGECVSYRPVEMEFHPQANQVEFVFTPSTLNERQLADSQRLAEQVAHGLEHVGLLAVELFLNDEGTLLINEVAPRPHNSGHLTIEAAMTSQFEQHLRTILGLPFGNCQFFHDAIMVNLVGAKGFHGPVVYEGMDDLLDISGLHVHLYGKVETRPMRKMGHITLVGSDIDILRQAAKQVKQQVTVRSEES
jgi:5-(carboxyamino)imidazole ribonucleotide synthase